MTGVVEAMIEAGPGAAGSPEARAWAGEPIDLPTPTPEEITAITTAAVERANARIAQAIEAARAAGAEGRAPSFRALFGGLDDAARELGIAFGRGAAQYNMATDDAVREASGAAVETIERWKAEVVMREDLAEVIERYVANGGLEGLSHLEGAYVERWRQDIRHAGGGLSAEDRAAFARLTSRLLEVQSAFLANLAKPPTILVTPAELDGVPAEIRDSARPIAGDPDHLELDVYGGVYIEIATGAPSRSLRERAYRAFNGQAIPANLDLITEAASIRRQLAALVGYPSWQAYRAENLAAPSPAFMNEFILGTAERLRPVVEQDIAAMTAVMREQPDCPADARLWDWDWRYADGIQRKALGADPGQVREYFELEHVLEAMARLCSETFGIGLVPRPERNGWDPAVRPFDVVDVASGRVLAYLYMDPWARPGKQFGAWMEILLPGGGHDALDRPPTMSLVLNGTPPSEGPALLSALQVETLFHEFGHVMNHAVGHGPFVVHRERWMKFDFIEGPSEFMGRWCLQPEVVRQYGRHHVTGAPIPDQLVDALVRSEALNAGFDMLRVLAQARFDALIHGETEISVADATRQAWSIRGMPMIEGTSIPATLTHIVSGAYDGALYGYAWSEVIRDNLLERFETAGLLAPETGARYRRTILEVPFLEDPVAAVNAFLGRPWSAEAFMRRAGGEPGGA